MRKDKPSKRKASIDFFEDMDEQGYFDRNAWENDFEVVDLETLDADDEDEAPRSTMSLSLSTPMLRWQHGFKRHHWRAVFVTGSLLLVCLLLFLNLQGLTFLTTKARTSIASRFVHVPPKLTEHLPAPVKLNPSLALTSMQLGFSCIAGEAWSPDSITIAIVGYSMGCENNATPSIGLAVLLDTHSGQRLASFLPDVSISKAFTAQYPTLHDILYIYYGSASWSPDKRHIALLFTIFAQASEGGLQFTGALVYDRQNGSSRVFIQQNVADYAMQGNASSYWEWDTNSGNAVPTPINEVSDPFFTSSNIQSAESYSWGKNGVLLPQTQKTVSSSKIGNMGGDVSFSIWQPGEITLMKQDTYGGITYAPGIFVWIVNFVAWSPDGRYLVQNAYTAARLELPGYPKPTQKILQVFHLENVPTVPIRDNALLSTLKLMSSGNLHVSDVANRIFVGWSPNGQLMWMDSYENSMGALYNTKYGYPTAILLKPSRRTLNAQSSHEGYYTWVSPSWSPDGLHLLVQDPNTNAIVIWNIPRSLL